MQCLLIITSAILISFDSGDDDVVAISPKPSLKASEEVQSKDPAGAEEPKAPRPSPSKMVCPQDDDPNLSASLAAANKVLTKVKAKGIAIASENPAEIPSSHVSSFDSFNLH